MFTMAKGISWLSNSIVSTFGGFKARYGRTVLFIVPSAIFLSAMFTAPLNAAAPPLDDNGLVLAAGDRTSVIAETTANNTTNNNGTEWYYRPNYSMGFAPAGASVELNTADTTNDLATEPYRVSWHMNGYNMVDGWRAGLETGVSEDGLRYIYQSNSTPSYYPNGPQTNVDPATVTGGGWTLCYSGNYSETVDTADLFANTCTGDYLLYAATLSPSNYFDITVNGGSILQELGDSMAEWPVFPDDTLEMNLYDDDGTTPVAWDDFIVYKSIDCNPQDCEPNDSPLSTPSSWDAGTLVTNGEYLVDDEDADQWLWVYQADDATGEAVDTADYIRLKVLPAPVDLVIDDCEELQGIDDFISSEYATVTLEGDIDCEGQEFEPLFQENSFQGTIDGAGHTIRNLTINQPEDSDIALISGATRVATVMDLNLENFDITGSYQVAGLLANVDGGLDITNVHGQNMNITSTYEGYAGGLFGDVDIEDGFDSIIENVSVKGRVTGSGEYSVNIGGIAGMIEVQSTDVAINKVYANVLVENNTEENTEEQFSDVGGLFGELESDNDYDGGDSATITLTNAYAWGDVVAENSENVGGLVGRVDVEFESVPISAAITIQNVYARGDVTGGGDVGGLFGQLDEIYDAEETVYTLENSFAMGAVAEMDELPETSAGGLVGFFEDDAFDFFASSDNFFDQTRTGKNVCNDLVEVTDCSPVNATGNQSDYFINNSSNAPLNDWDFEGVWVANEDVPPTFLEYELGEDLNGDFVNDEDQSNISGYENPYTGKMVAIDVGEECEITTDDIVEESSLAAQDSGYEYENGLFDFAGDCGEPGFTTTVSLYYYGVSSEDVVLRKFNPNTKQYGTIEEASISDTTIHGEDVAVVTYQITDGESLDTDTEVNGEFTDPAGVATIASESGDLATTGRSIALLYALASVFLLVPVIMVVRRRRLARRHN